MAGEDLTDAPKRSRWLTKRMFFSVTGLVTATVMVYTGKMDAGNWVFSLAVVIAGHHAEDIVKAMRNRDGTT